MAGFTDIEKKRFEKIKKLTLDVIRTMDNNKMLNYNKYVDMFKVFEEDPDEFRHWEVLNSTELDSCPTLLQLPFEEVKIPAMKKAADILGIELEEYIYYRHTDPRGVRSMMKVPVGYITIKRVQQILSKKNHYCLDVDDRSLKTNTVKGHSKVGGLTEPETYRLASLGCEKAIEEFLGFRADNMDAKMQAYRQIAQDGYCTLSNLQSRPSSHTTLNTINTYLLAAGIRSDLITNTLETDWTLNGSLGLNK